MPTASKFRTAWRVLRAILVGYLLILLLLMIFENSLIFLPAKYPIGDWSPDLPVEDADFVAADGTRLHGWYLHHERPRAVILHAHGNAGNLTHRLDVMQRIHSQADASVMLFDYRGYGRSQGSPSERGVLEDARAARDWLAQRAGIGTDEVVLMGRSLGGAVAVDLAVDGGARALVLESTFTSLPDVAAVHYPWVPVRLLLRTRLDSLAKIARYDGPLLMSHGEADEIVPFELGKQLFDRAATGDKRLLTIRQRGHNDPQPDWYYDELEAFLEQLDPAAE